MTNTDLLSTLVQLPDLCPLCQPQECMLDSLSPCRNQSLGGQKTDLYIPRNLIDNKKWKKI